MWDPRTYTDTDFGLDDDESFEPDDLPDSPVDPSRDAHVMTVLGPIDPGDLGICLPFEHLLRDPEHLSDSRYQLTDVMRATEELSHFATVGGQGIVDATTREQGRDILGLRQIARIVPVHVIAATGGRWHFDDDQASVATLIREEVTQGVGPRRVRPGVILAQLEAQQLEQVHRNWLEGIAQAGIETRLPVLLETSGGLAANEAAHALLETGLPAAQIIVRIPPDDVRAIWLHDVAASGVTMLFTAIGKAQPEVEREIATSIATLANQGYVPRLLISHAFDSRPDFLAWNGAPGWVYLLERFVLTLMDAGFDAPSVRSLIVDNPARALAIWPESRS